MTGKFIIQKKLVVQVRYYEHMYLIRDGEGERVYIGSDEKVARRILAILNAYHGKRKTKRRVKKRDAK